MELTLSRRERHKEATRLALQEAALSLIEERGLAAVTVEAITERADVALRTFSNYFACKEDAVLGLEPATAGSLAASLAARPADEDPLASLRAVLVGHMVGHLEPVEATLRRIRVVNAEPELKGRLAGRFDQLTAGLVRVVAQRMGVDPDRDLYPTVLVSACANAARSALLWWSAQEPRAELEPILARAFDHLAAGLASPLGSSV